MNKSVLIIIFTIFLLTTIPISASQAENTVFETKNNHTLDNILGARIINSTHVYVNQPVNLTTIINNPTTWTLKNASFVISLSKDINIIGALNTTNVITHIKELEEEVSVQVNITLIPMNSRVMHWIVIKFKKEGKYNIRESTVSFIKQKGELIEKGSIVIPTITITVLKPEKPYPEEGSKDITILTLIITVIVPLIIISISHRVAWKE